MLDFLHRVRERAGFSRWRRIAVWAARETGDTMIEVVIAALIVGLIAAAVFVGFGAVAQLSGGQRHEAQANEIAQQDEERLRGLTVTQLSGATSATGASAVALYGNGSYQETLDGQTYTVTSTSKFVSASGASPSCTASGTGNADYIETASTVTWANNNDGLPAVVEHGLISPHVGGSLVIQATDGSQPTPNPLPGVPIHVTGSDTGTLTLTTDSNGCAVFAGLPGGTYTVSWPGYIQENTAASSATVLVVDGSTETDSYELGQPGTIQASFTTTYGTHTNVAATTDTFVASNSQLTSPIVSGTPSTLASSASYTSPISSGATIFPLAGTNDAYSVYAGDCVGDAPPSPATTVVTPGGTSNVTVPEPAMLVDVWGGNSTWVDDAPSSAVVYTGSHWTHGATGNQNYDSTESFDLTAGDYVKFTFTGSAVQWIAPVSNNEGYANIYLDGSLVATNVTAYAATTAYQQVIWSDTGLSNTSHTLEIYVDGTKPAASSSTYVAIDAFTYVTPTLLATAPNVTLTDNNCAGHESYPNTQVPTSAQGALTNPGEPYGNFTVCADNGSVKNTATVANTNFTNVGNTVNVFLYSGASGLTSGTCT
jgi:Tfp pilus assembly protein PilE